MLRGDSEKSYPVGDRAGHAGNECHASTIAELDHLLRNCLGSHEDTSNVHLKHSIGILGLVLERWCFLLNPGSCHQTVHPSFDARNVFDDLVKPIDVSYIDLSVFEL